MADRQKREKLTPQLITSAAFIAWGKTFFTEKSLSAVARELEITKPALYRHFRNKAALEEALIQEFSDAYGASVLDRIPASFSTRSDFVPVFATLVHEFFRANPYFYAFMVHQVLRFHAPAGEALGTLWDRQYRLIREILGTTPDGRLTSPEDLDDMVRYVINATAFWTSRSLRLHTSMQNGVTVFDPAGVPDDEEHSRRTIDEAVVTILTGCVHKPLTRSELDLVEQVAWIHPEDMLEPDRIITAIEAVVLEVGYPEATIERIAARLGMTKSSLYFYFRNKDDMLGSMVRREQQHFLRLVRQRFQVLPSPEQRLYSLFVMNASYSLNHPSWSTVQSWLQHNRIEFSPAPKHRAEAVRFVQELQEMVSGQSENGDDRTGLEILSFITLLVRHCLQHRGFSAEKASVLRSIRRLYTYFIHGILPEEPEEDNR